MLTDQARLDIDAAGMTDGYSASPPDPSYKFNISYMEGYAAGIQEWLKELKRRREELYNTASTEF